jgi:hypothetical protein
MIKTETEVISKSGRNLRSVLLTQTMSLTLMTEKFPIHVCSKGRSQNSILPTFFKAGMTRDVNADRLLRKKLLPILDRLGASINLRASQFETERSPVML